MLSCPPRFPTLSSTQDSSCILLLPTTHAYHSLACGNFHPLLHQPTRIIITICYSRNCLCQRRDDCCIFPCEALDRCRFRLHYFSQAVPMERHESTILCILSRVISELELVHESDWRNMAHTAAIIDSAVFVRFLELWRESAPVSVVDQDICRPLVHMSLNSLIVVTSRVLLSELLLVMDEDTCEDAGQDLSPGGVFADLVYPVNMEKTTAFQTLRVHQRANK
jgi:hypothetical protein